MRITVNFRIDIFIKPPQQYLSMINVNKYPIQLSVSMCSCIKMLFILNIGEMEKKEVKYKLCLDPVCSDMRECVLRVE